MFLYSGACVLEKDGLVQRAVEISRLLVKPCSLNALSLVVAATYRGGSIEVLATINGSELKMMGFVWN